ncbi:MAG TPA: hypothetical protein VK390_08855 [Propionibacteriaceae bacterium]|jgi:hypothetical protein|nr:hypothetical protein [Propionibacteriaceae bacterium]
MVDVLTAAHDCLVVVDPLDLFRRQHVHLEVRLGQTGRYGSSDLTG